ncbi:MAG TPA: hypothetical protein VHX61_04640 [Rhizomicrobium sp.]|jgi:hypothetical protein|nr:hypothetical protein [Rhizomicrobium sp.]
MPGAPLKKGTFVNLNGSGGPNFAITFPGKGLKLGAGHYWVSVIANMSFGPNGWWGQYVNSVQHGYQAVWRNEGGCFGICQTWYTLAYVNRGPDLMFALKGKSRANKPG